MNENGKTAVVVAGGGVAAIEAVLALRDVAGDRVASGDRPLRPYG